MFLNQLLSFDKLIYAEESFSMKLKAAPAQKDLKIMASPIFLSDIFQHSANVSSFKYKPFFMYTTEGLDRGEKHHMFYKSCNRNCEILQSTLPQYHC